MSLKSIKKDMGDGFTLIGVAIIAVILLSKIGEIGGNAVQTINNNGINAIILILAFSGAIGLLWLIVQIIDSFNHGGI